MERYFSDIPFDYSPGLAQYLARGDFLFSGFFATILRLEDKKAINIKSKGGRFYPTLKTSKPKAGLSESEEVAYAFLSESLETRKSFTYLELERLLSRKFRDYYYRYQCALMHEFSAHKFTAIPQLKAPKRAPKKPCRLQVRWS